MASTFSKSVQQWVKVNEYATKRVAGVTIGNRQSVIRKCRAGMPVRFEREPKNKADPNAIAVYAEGNQIGYLPADVAKWAASNLDSGRVQYRSRVAEVWSFVPGDDSDDWDDDDAQPTTTRDIKPDEILMISVTMDCYEQREVQVFSAWKVIVHGAAIVFRGIAASFRWGSTIVRKVVIPRVRASIVSLSSMTDAALKTVSGNDAWLHWLLRFVALVLFVGTIVILVDWIM